MRRTKEDAEKTRHAILAAAEQLLDMAAGAGPLRPLGSALVVALQAPEQTGQRARLGAVAQQPGAAPQRQQLGENGGGVVVVVVVVVVVLDSSGVPLSVLHPAVTPIIAMAAPRPTPAAIRRRRTDAILVLYWVSSS